MFLSYTSTQSIDYSVDDFSEKSQDTAEGMVSPFPQARKNKFLKEISKDSNKHVAHVKLTEIAGFSPKGQTMIAIMPITGGKKPAKPYSVSSRKNPSENTLSNCESASIRWKVGLDSIYNEVAQNQSVQENGEDVFIDQEGQSKSLLRKQTLPMRSNIRSSTALSFDIRLDPASGSLRPAMRSFIQSITEEDLENDQGQIDTVIDCEELLKEHSDLSKYIQSKKQVREESSESSVKYTFSKNFTSVSPDRDLRSNYSNLNFR